MISRGFDERCQRDRHAENLGEGSRGGEYPAESMASRKHFRKKKAAYIYIHTDSHRTSTDTQCTAIEIYTMIATSLYTAMAIHHALIQILSNPTHSQRFPKPSISSSPLQPYFYRHWHKQPMAFHCHHKHTQTTTCTHLWHSYSFLSDVYKLASITYMAL